MKIENINFVNFGGESIVKMVGNASNVAISNLKIQSCQKDTNNNLKFYGFVHQVGDVDNWLRPSTLTLYQCHLNDEFVTVVSPIIDTLNFWNKVNVQFCSNHANFEKSAIISTDRSQTTEHKYGYWDSRDNNKALRNIGTTSINVNYFSNYGNGNNLINATGSEAGYYGSNGTYYKTTVKKSYGSTYVKHNVEVDNIYNSGTLTLAFKNSNIVDYSGEYINRFYNGSNVSTFDGYASIFSKDSFQINKFVNFGEIGKLFEYNEKDVEISGATYYSPIKANYIYNAGKTLETSASSEFGLYSFYEVIPYTELDEEVGLNIDSISQCTAEFFRGSMDLNETYWDLSYIKIDDEYGSRLSTIDH